MQRRTFLLSVGGTAIAGGAALGSGAFSQVAADRTVDITVAGDADAYLQIEGDADFTTTTTDNTVKINLAALDANADGVDDALGANKNATTTIASILTVTNNGRNDVNSLSFSDDGSLGAGEEITFSDDGSLPLATGASAAVDMTVTTTTGDIAGTTITISASN